MKSANEIYDEISRKKIGYNSHKKWHWKLSFAGRIGNESTLEFIQRSLNDGCKVKSGYTCTQIRGYHDKWILILPPHTKKNKQ